MQSRFCLGQNLTGACLRKKILVGGLLELGQSYLNQYLTEAVLTNRKLLISMFYEEKIYLRHI